MTDNKLKEIKASLEIRKIREEACYDGVTSELKNAIDLYNEVVDCHDNKNNLIKYLEKESKKVYRDGGIRQNIFLDILERVKSGKYD